MQDSNINVQTGFKLIITLCNFIFVMLMFTLILIVSLGVSYCLIQFEMYGIYFVIIGILKAMFVLLVVLLFLHLFKGFDKVYENEQKKRKLEFIEEIKEKLNKNKNGRRH